jgi:hypothetical protein
MDFREIAMVSKFAAPTLFAIVCIGVQAQDFGTTSPAKGSIDNRPAYQPSSSAIVGFDAGQRLMQRQQQIRDQAQARREHELERELQQAQQRDHRIQQARQERELQQLRRQVAAAREAQARVQQEERGHDAEHVPGAATRHQAGS